jgi:hypothetical protein
MNKSLFTAATIVFVFANTGSAADITYNVDQTIGAGSVIGFIDTDGTLGTLGSGDIADWNLEVSDGSTSFDLLGPFEAGWNSSVSTNGSNLSATALQLTFDFSADDFGYLLFQDLNQGGQFYCAQDGSLLCYNPCPPAYGACPAGEGLNPINNDGPDQYNSIDTPTVIGTSSAAPEPTTLVLMIAGLGLSLMAKRKVPE